MGRTAEMYRYGLCLLATAFLGCSPATGEVPAPADPGDSTWDATSAAQPVERPGKSEPKADPCDPQPSVGDPCPPSAGYCVESWGEPGGHSSALWCRDGRWEREQEKNLP